LGAADLAERLGDADFAGKLRSEALALRKNFHERFWDTQIECYALALDGQKRACGVRSSNAAHALFSGIAEPQAAASLVQTLFQPDMFTGWGIRTLSSNEANYHPLSYHNGSIWPHDNAIAAYGLSRYGYQKRAAQLLDCMLEASSYIPLQRMPEFYCGFSRRKGLGPTLHPIACSPQAWAAGSVFMVLQSCLGLSLDAVERRVVIEKPSLPESINRLEVRNLSLGESSIDLGFERYEHDVGVHVLRRGGDLSVAVLK
jgi:glycogen debranching enzyme